MESRAWMRRLRDCIKRNAKAGGTRNPGRHHFKTSSATLVMPKLGQLKPRHLLRNRDGRFRARSFFRDIGKCETCLESDATDRHHLDGDTWNNERSNIRFLCRSCHMKEDGRLKRFVKSGTNAGIKNRSPAQVCSICSRLSKPLRHGRCHRCNEYFRRTNREWSPEVKDKASKSRENCIARYCISWPQTFANRERQP